MAPPTVFVIDDDDAVRGSLKLLFKSINLPVGVFASAQEFLPRYSADQPGCLVVDVRMPGMSGLELQQQLNLRGAMIPVIFITGHGDIPMAVQAMKDGAFEFIQKPFRDQDLLDSINHALLVDSDHRDTLAKRAEVTRRHETLTPRERQVMALVVDGAPNKVIAIDLGLSERTVEIHRAKVMEKMAARSVAHLVKLHLGMTDSG